MSCVLALLIKLQQYSPWRSDAASQSSRLQVSHTPVSAWNKWSSHESNEPCLALPCGYTYIYTTPSPDRTSLLNFQHTSYTQPEPVRPNVQTPQHFATTQTPDS
jgi:hypothetical protein